MRFDFDVQGDTIRMLSGDGTAGETYDIGEVALIKDCVVTLDGADRVFGTAVAKLLTFTVDSAEIFEGERFDYYAMVQEDDDTEVTTHVGTFTAVRVLPEAATSLVAVTAIDGMVNFSVPYVSELDYEGGEVTIWDVVEELCASCGITLSDEQPEGLQNTEFVVAANPFPAGTLCREVLAQAAMVMGSFAQMVGGELRFVVPDSSADAAAVADTRECATMNLSRTVRRYNSVIIRSSTNDDDIESMQEDDPGDGPEPMIALAVTDNYFLHDAATRAAAIEGIFTNACLFAYYPFEAVGIAHPALNCGDVITVLDENGAAYTSVMLRMEYHSADEMGGMNNSVSAPGETLAAVEYEYPKSRAETLAAQAYIQSQTYADAITAITTLLNTPGGSYVKYKKTVDEALVDCQATDSPEEIWITSKETVDGETNVLRMNSAGLGYSSDGGANYTQAITGLGVLASSIVFDEGVGAKMVIGVADAQRVEIYASGDEPYIDAYDAGGVLRSRWNYNGLKFTNSDGDVEINLASTLENMTITVGSGKDFAHPQDAIDYLSQYFINHVVTINIDAGTYDGNLIIKNKAGYGEINIGAVGVGDIVMTGYVEANHLLPRLLIWNMKAGYFAVNHCLNFAAAFTTSDDDDYDDGYWIQNSHAYLYETIISNKGNIAVEAHGSVVYIESISGSGNLTGYMNDYGSMQIWDDTLSASAYQYDGVIKVDGVLTVGGVALTPATGWNSISAECAYVSATSFTLPGNWTGKLQKGDPLMWTQNGTVRYSNIAATPTYSAGTEKTTVTKHAGYVTSSGDCDVLNTATYPITNAYYAKIPTPQGFPFRFNWTSILTGFSAGNDPTNCVYLFRLLGTECVLDMRQATDGTSNATTFTGSLPIQAATITNMYYVGICTIRDNGATQQWFGQITINSDATTFGVYKDVSATAFTTSGGKRFGTANIRYSI
jgi:hypothetical protein